MGEYQRTDGSSGEYVSMLGYDSQKKNYICVLCFAPAKILIFHGKAGAEEGTFEFMGNGLRWCWKSVPEEKRQDSSVEVDQGEGKWKLISRSKSVRIDR